MKHFGRKTEVRRVDEFEKRRSGRKANAETQSALRRAEILEEANESAEGGFAERCGAENGRSDCGVIKSAA